MGESFEYKVLASLGDIRVLCERLAGHNEAITERVVKLEAAQTRQWWVSFVITPVVILLGHIARALGVKA